MKLIDFHCDTPSGLLRGHTKLSRNDLQVDIEKTSGYDAYCQVAAFFCSARYSDNEGFLRIQQLSAYLRRCVAECENAVLVANGDALQAAFEQGKRVFLPAVEDLRVLGGDVSRVRILADMGVRFATLVWRDKSCIGGAWNTEAGLTAFGQEAVSALLENGIVPDVSHASRATFKDTECLCRAAGKPFAATHSCAYSLCAHGRNLTDEEMRAIAESGGVIGVNLYPPFLHESGTANMEDVLHHIQHLFNVAGKETVVVGSDLDGVDRLPTGISDVSDLANIAETMHAKGFCQDDIDLLFYRNGLRFIKENF